MKNIYLVVIIVVLAIIAFVLYGYAKKDQIMKDQTNKEIETSNDGTKNSDMLTSSSSSKSVSEANQVQYFTNSAGKKFTGYYAAPDTLGRYPGVVIMHEWWGLNDNIKQMAEELAKQGYQVFAVDLYGGKVAQNADEARSLVQKVPSTETTANMKAAVEYLRSQGASKVASLGWCYGGGKSLELALSGEKLNAVVVYYGTPLVTDKNALSKIPAPVLGIFGDKDTAIPVQTVKDFEAGLVMNDIKNEIEIYPGVGHAFANPSGANYAPEATKDAWNKTLKFLAENLK